MRVVFTAADLAVDLSALQTGFTAIAERFGMDWPMRDGANRRRVMLLVSPPITAWSISSIAGASANLR